ncbi:hypothetical protein ACFZCL_32440 [Streptomyces sp. NPDC008159]|uniref:hypothetical protein n=1 Tax=Streptomyces sp. NPDC008159 TaxID=3364817 RepID=UPI0036ECCA42
MSGTHGQAADRRTEHLFQLDLAESLNEAYAWVTRIQVAQFVGILSRMREEHREAMAMRALHAFALRRPVHELVRLADHFDGRDAVMLMATAALSRPVGEAAELALMQYEAESGGERAPITASIVHDVACQRTAFDVAVFVRVLEQREPTLAKRTVQVFASPGSGRTNLDKALLHTALRDEGCHREADRLLGLTLRAIADSPPGTAGPGGPGGAGEEGEEMADLAGAFQHLSPAGRILERWVEERLNASDATEVERTRELVARLIARRGAGHDALAEHIGRTAQPRHVVKLCALLARGDTASPAKCALVRRYAAGHKNVQELAVLVAFWHKEPALTRTTRDLLTDIVARDADRGTAGPDTAVQGAAPRPLEQLEQLDDWLREADADPECSRLLRHAAAVWVEGRSGADLVRLLGRVERSRDRSRAAHTVGRRLAMAVMRPEEDQDQDREHDHDRDQDREHHHDRDQDRDQDLDRDGDRYRELDRDEGRDQGPDEGQAHYRDEGQAHYRDEGREHGPDEDPDDVQDRARKRFVDCLRALYEAKHIGAVRAACRELSDPPRGVPVDAALVADVASRLHRAGLHKVAWTLLERFLENEQLVTPADVVEVVGGVLALPLPDAELLLRATVGRWSDGGHRDDAVAALRVAGRCEAADWVIKSLR